MEFRAILYNRITEILESWPQQDQYAIMFFIYPNECFEYGRYSNIPEFQMLYKCESDMSQNPVPVFGASSTDEERWNPAFWWDCHEAQTVIGFDEPNPVADALIAWYESTGIQNIRIEDEDHIYDSNMLYIGRCPNGLPELLNLVTDIALELQTNGIIEAKFGRKYPSSLQILSLHGI